MSPLQVACSSSPRHEQQRFQREFNPRDSNVPRDLRFGYQGFVDLEQPNVPEPADPAYWKQGPPGSFKVSNPHATNTRLTPIHIDTPKSKVPFPFNSEEYYAVEIERNYSKEWPSISMENGKVVFKKGFLQPLDDPDLPNFFFYKGIERFQFSLTDKVFHTLVAAVYLTICASIFGALWTVNYSLAGALLVNWVRNRLSFGKMAVLAVLAATGKLWLYWVFFAGARVDELMQQYAEPVRK